MTRPRTGFPFLDSGLEHPGSVLAFAHRGGAYHPEIEGLENTLAAFQHAVDLGYEYLETDVHASKDGVLLAFHDDHLDRVTDRTGPLAALEHAEVSEALIGGREQIPTLAALLERFPTVRFNIDIKSDTAVEPLVRLMREMDAEERICVGSFSERRIARFRALTEHRIPTAAGPREVATVRFAPTTRLVDVLTRNRAAALQVPHRAGRITVVTRSLVARAHALGKHVHVWIVDDPDEMHHLLDLGVDGLMTDRTDLLREVLIERGQWRGRAA